MSSGTLHFPAILVTVTCNPRRCVRTPLSGRERKDFSEPELSRMSIRYMCQSVESERVTTTEDLPPNLR